MNWKSEALALIFGALIILCIFDDATTFRWVGNLDTIFGLTYWPLMDVTYPLASIVALLLYGKSKGSFRLRRSSLLLFSAFMAALTATRLDDILGVLNYAGVIRPIDLGTTYWAVATWLYVLTAVPAFFAFGQSCRQSAGRPQGQPD
jgi:hypothetical protein